MTKMWCKSFWYKDYARDGLCFKYGGYLEEGEIIEPDLVLPAMAYVELKQWMIENDADGVIRTDRKEDLKLIHRLVDIIEKGVENNVRT